MPLKYSRATTTALRSRLRSGGVKLTGKARTRLDRPVTFSRFFLHHDVGEPHGVVNCTASDVSKGHFPTHMQVTFCLTPDNSPLCLADNEKAKSGLGAPCDWITRRAAPPIQVCRSTLALSQATLGRTVEQGSSCLEEHGAVIGRQGQGDSLATIGAVQLARASRRPWRSRRSVSTRSPGNADESSSAPTQLTAWLIRLTSSGLCGWIRDA